MTDSSTRYDGYCPERGKLLVREMNERDVDARMSFDVRCPSCDHHYHSIGQLEWRER
jgi:hypothetical protein